MHHFNGSTRRYRNRYFRFTRWVPSPLLLPAVCRRLPVRFLIWLCLLPVATALGVSLVLTRARAAPQTYTVNSLADTDDGACDANNCTLREAINAANANSGADTIKFSVSGTITVSSVWKPTDDLTIDGAGQTIILDGANQHEVFSMLEVGISFSLKNLTIANGVGETCGDPAFCSGGGIWFNLATVNITNCTFSNNSATNTGGAIEMFGNVGALTITNSTFANNHAARLGGAISSDGNLTITNSSFSGNTSGDAGGALIWTAFLGVGSLNVTGSNFSGNSAANTGGGIDASNGPVTITGSTFSGNSVTSAGGFGGGMSSFHSSLFVTNSTFSNNTAQGVGGGLHTVGTASVVGSLFSGNGAQGGGAIANFIDRSLPSSLALATTTFSGNSASSNAAAAVGGALFNQGNEMTVTSCTFSGNTVSSSTQLTLGGAIYNSTEAFWHNSASLKVTNSTFSGNSGLSFGPGAAGGAIYNKAAPLILTNSTLSGNSAGLATSSGGGIYTESSNPVSLRNTILANNVGDCISNASTVTGNNNLIMDNSTACGLTNGANGNLVGVDPLLGQLANNGGPTKTLALGFGSPAINAGAAVTTLNGAIDNAVTSIVVADATAFPATGGFAIQIDNEQMIVTGKSGNTLTVTRAANSTLANGHANGAVVNPAFDQRGAGFPRKFGTQIDIGAFEHYPLAITAAAGIARLPGSSANSQIATVHYDGAVGNIVVTVTSNNPSNGVTLSNIVNTNGTITADVAAAAGAATTTFTLQASDGTLIATDTLTVTVCTSTPPTPTVTGATNGTGTQDQACPEEPLTLTASSNGATSFQWYKDGNLISGQTSPTLNVTAAGTYAAKAIAANGCPSGQSAGYVVQNPTPAKPLITPQGPTAFCLGGSVTLQSNLATGIQWYKDDVPIPGATSQSYVATAAGSYKAQLNALGCLSQFSDPITVTASPPQVTVTNSNDAGAGSLRQAILDVCDGGTISFDMTPGHVTSPITLTSGELPINRNLMITGPGASLLTVDGNQASRVFNIGGGLTTTISGLTIANGKITGGALNLGGGIFIGAGGALTLTNSNVSGNSATGGNSSNWGGGIFVDRNGTLTVTSSTLSGNSVSGGFNAIGGAILHRGGGTLTITNSTLSGNSATVSPSNEGGAIAMFDSGTAAITNSTLSDNSVSGDLHGANSGGAILNVSSLTITNSTLFGNSVTGGNSANRGGAIYNQSTAATTPTLILTNTTLFGNSSTAGPENSGGGIYNELAGILKTRNSIIANNVSTAGPDIFGPLTSQGHNLISNTSGTTITGDTTGNILNQDPKLAPLFNNGGPTHTMALLSGSPAFDAGDDCVFDNSCSPALAAALMTDQRGGSFSRKAGAHVDIGAFEVNGLLQTGSPSLVVNQIDDHFDGSCTTNDCTLREAVNTANALAGANTITFDPALTAGGPATITLTGGELFITGDLTVTGPGANLLTVSGNQASRIFNIGGVTANISGLAIANGKVTGGFSNLGGGIFIDSGGALTLSNSTLSGNSASSVAFNFPASFQNFGGGIYNNGGTLTISNSTLSGNSTTGSPVNLGDTVQNFGGAVFNNGGTLTVTNSTLSGNSATGGAINFGGAISNFGTLTLTNSTLAGNSANSLGGAIFNGGTVNARNTIIANNTGAGPDFAGTLTSQGHNLIGNTAGVTITGDTTGNILNQDPKLGPLANNGGPTQTMLLLPGSPAIDAADDCVFNNSCSPLLAAALTTDQRLGSFTRKISAHVDMGAVEVNYAIAATAGNTQSTIINTAFATQLQATVTESGVPVSGVTVSFTAPGSGASGSFPGNLTTASVLTNGSGVAPAPSFTANGTAGSYSVVATLGAGLPSATFALTNLKANQTITFGPIANKTFGDPDFLIIPSASSGLPVTLLASGNCTVSSPSPGSVHLTGAGSCTITASQPGDAYYNPAPSVPQSFTIAKVATANEVASSLNPSNLNQPVTFTARVSSVAAKTGTVQFKDNGVNLGAPVVLSGSGIAQFTTSTLTAGTHAITAEYSGDANFLPSTGTLAGGQLVRATTNTAVTSSFNPSDLGQSVTFTARVTSVSLMTGMVQFKDNGVNLGAPVALNGSGIAQFTTSTLTSGTHTITAEYSGDVTFLPSTGTLPGGQVVRTIPTLSINDVSITEGNAGTKVLAFTVTLSAGSNLPVSVNYATANGTATAGSDYMATSGSFTFNPFDNDVTRTVNVTIDGDVSFEPDETFTVNLTNPVNALLSKATGTGTIQNDDAQGGFLSFNQANYGVNESAGLITLTVTRSNDVSQAVNVDYATDDTGASTNCAALNSGLASQRCDFGSVFGTLKFAANETQKTIDVPINLDAFTEGPESFTVKLSNATGGAVLQAPAMATVTINDSASPTPNAIDDTTTFVRQQYRDFLNRDADPAGLAFWKNNIDKCNDPLQRPPGQTLAQCIEGQRILTSGSFFLSIEFKQTGGLVRDFYVTALDRPATNNMPNYVEFMRDTQGIQKGVVVGQGNWQQVLDANRTAFMNDFVTRAEFVSLYPTTDTPAQYVDRLYLHAGVMPANPAERNAAIAEFGGAGTAADPGARGRALLRITQNAAFQTRELPRGFVQMQYFGYLRRNPNDAPDNNFNGYNFWLNKLLAANGDFLQAEMVKAFLSSLEYRGRFGP